MSPPSEESHTPLQPSPVLSPQACRPCVCQVSTLFFAGFKAWLRDRFTLRWCAAPSECKKCLYNKMGVERDTLSPQKWLHGWYREKTAQKLKGVHPQIQATRGLLEEGWSEHDLNRKNGKGGCTLGVKAWMWDAEAGWGRSQECPAWVWIWDKPREKGGWLVPVGLAYW